MSITFLDNTDKADLQRGIDNNAAAITTERARVNELVAMRGNGDYNEWISDEWEERGHRLRLISNGISALVNYEHRTVEWGSIFNLTFQLPENFQPLGYKEIFNNGKILCYVEKTDGAQLVIKNISGGIIGSPPNPITGDYPLAQPAVMEMVDLRVGIDGKTYTSAGEAVRSQFMETDKRQIDKLAPAFEASGPVVTCRPVEGYPLEVVSHLVASDSHIPEVKLTRCGKNLAHCTTTHSGNQGGLAYSRRIGDSFITLNGTATAESSIGMVADLPLKAGIYSLSVHAANYVDASHDRAYVTWPNIPVSYPVAMTNKPTTFTLDTDTTVSVHFVFQTGSTYNNTKVCFQIEAGNTATDLDQYKGETFTCPLNTATPIYGGTFNWATGTLTDYNGNTHQLTPQGITALSGVNTLFSDTGDTYVAGRADPVAIINDLQTRLAALEAAVVNNA